MEEDTIGNVSKSESGRGWPVKVLISLAVFLAYVLFLLFFQWVLTAIGKPYQIPSSSMLPAIESGDRILVNRMAYDSSPISRGDIIVFDKASIGFSNIPYVKRVIGLPGDKVEIRNGQVLVNNTEFIVSAADKPNYVVPATTVPEGNFYVLGDSRNQSMDSHVWGFIQSRDVVGRADLVYWPPNRVGTLANSDPVFYILITASGLFSIFLLPVICSIIAAKRNRHAIGWFFLGFLCSVIPLIILILLPAKRSHQDDIPEPM